VIAAMSGIPLVVFLLMVLLVFGAAAGAGAFLVLRKRSEAAGFVAAASVGIGVLFVLLFLLGFFWMTLSFRVESRPQPGLQAAVAPPKTQFSKFLERSPAEAGLKASGSPSMAPSPASSPTAESSTDASRPQTAPSQNADAPAVSGAAGAPAPASTAPPKAEAEVPAANDSSAQQPGGASSDEHQDQQALGELRRRIFERVVVALREIIAEEMPADGSNSAESAIDSAISAAIDQRPMAEKPLPPPASPPDWLSAAGSAGSANAAGSANSVVVVGPHVDAAECERHLYEAVQPVVAEFVANYLGPQWRDRVTLPEEFVRTELIRDRYVETVPASFGPMVQLHLLLSFDGKVKAQLAAQQLELVRRQRIAAIAAVFGGFLGCMAVAYVALRHDAAHGGRGRSGTIVWAGTAASLCIVLTVAAMRYVTF